MGPRSRGSARGEVLNQKVGKNGQGKVRADQTAPQHRHHRSRRSWQDVADGGDHQGSGRDGRSEEHTSELQPLMRRSYAVFYLNQKNTHNPSTTHNNPVTTQ